MWIKQKKSLTNRREKQSATHAARTRFSLTHPFCLCVCVNMCMFIFSFFFTLFHSFSSVFFRASFLFPTSPRLDRAGSVSWPKVRRHRHFSETSLRQRKSATRPPPVFESPFTLASDVRWRERCEHEGYTTMHSHRQVKKRGTWWIPIVFIIGRRRRCVAAMRQQRKKSAAGRKYVIVTSRYLLPVP